MKILPWILSKAVEKIKVTKVPVQPVTQLL